MKKSTIRLIIVAAAAILIIFVTAKVTSQNVYEKKAAEEKEKMKTVTYTELDSYSMQEFCHENAEAVMKALKEGDEEALKGLLISSDGLEDVMSFADWSTADFDQAVSLGSGSLTTEPNKKGKMDVSERFFVDTDQGKFVFFIETVSSSWGRVNDGVSAVGVMAFKDFDADDYVWNGEKGSRSVLCGKLFWNK